jgi:HEAT repeat protein
MNACRRFFCVALTAAVFVASDLAMTPLRASAFVPQESGHAYAVLISADEARATALTALTQTLTARYGVEEVTTLRGADATAARIESTLGQRLANLESRDQLFVVLALALHEKGEDRLMVTGDFDPAKPWTGLPTAALRKLAAGATAGTVVIVHPGCRNIDSVVNAMMQQVSQNRHESVSPTLIGYCGLSAEAADTFLQALRDGLDEIARKPSTRAPWQTRDELGLVSVADLTDRLTARDGDRRWAVEPGAGNGWLRVFGTTVPTSAGDPIPLGALREADSVSDARAALQTLVTTARASDETAQRGIAAALADYVLDDSVAAPRRGLATQALGDFSPDVGRAALERIFRESRDVTVRTTALDEWASLAGDADPALLRVALDDADPQVQIAAIQWLARAGVQPARPALEARLRDSPDAKVRAAAARAIEKLLTTGDSPAMFFPAVQDPDPGVRLEAVGALGRVPANADAVVALRRALSDTDAPVRESAAYALAQHWPAMSAATATAVAQSLVQQATGRAGEGERAAALRTLARGNRRETARAIETLVAATQPAVVRLAAVEALAGFADARSAQVLVGVAMEAKTELRLRLAATRALGKLEDPRAADALFTLATDPQIEIASAASGALGESRARSPRALQLAAVGKSPPSLRLLAIDLLGRNGDPRATEVLLRLLRDDDAVINEHAALALSQYAGRSTIEALAALLRDSSTSARVRIAAARALGAMRSAEANAVLLRYANDANESLRVAVATAIDAGTLQPGDRSALLRLARDSSAAVRRSVTGALGAIGQSDAIATLRTLSEDADPGVRAAAIESLRGAEQRASVPPEPAVGVVYARGNAPATQRSLRLDVFWCAGDGDDARRAQAQQVADALSTYAQTLKGADATIGTVRVRALEARINAQPGYRLARNEIRYEPGDAFERAWAERLLARWGATFTAHPVENRTADYISLFVCGGR